MHEQLTDVATRALALETRLGAQHAGVNELIAGVNNLSVKLDTATTAAAAFPDSNPTVTTPFTNT